LGGGSVFVVGWLVWGGVFEGCGGGVFLGYGVLGFGVWWGGGGVVVAQSLRELLQ